MWEIWRLIANPTTKKDMHMECEVQETKQIGGQVQNAKDKGKHVQYVTQLSYVLKNKSIPQETQDSLMHASDTHLIDVPIIQSSSIVQPAQDRPRGANISCSSK